ncbi:MAG: YfhO family protein [Cyclobacteriaceae bacterium]
MQINFKKDILPHFLGILSFYLLVVIYFSPIVFEDKMMFQTDILKWEGSAKELLDHRENTGEEALWTNRMFGGMPAYLIHLDTKGDLTNGLIKVFTFGLPHPISALFFGMVSMYILLMSFKVRPLIAIVGSWAFVFNTFNFLSLQAGHNAKIWAVCLIPLILAGVHLAFSGKKMVGLAVTALAIMLQLKFNHLQITYYTLFVVGFYGLGQLLLSFKEKNLPAFGKVLIILLAGAIIGGMSNIARLATVLEYGKYSIRGERNLPAENRGNSGLDRDYAFNWSQGKLETFTLLIPNYMGGASQEALPENSAAEKALRSQGMDNNQINQFINAAPTYWGDQPFTGGPIYGGAIMAFLFILGVFFSPPMYRNVFLILTAFTLMLSWGKNLAWFNYTLFDYFPGYNKFRAVSMALGITLFAVPVMGSLGLENFIRNQNDPKSKKQFFIGLGITLGLLLAGIIMAGWAGYQGGSRISGYPEWLQEALKTDRKSILWSDTLRSLAFIILSALLLLLFLFHKITARWALLGVGFLLLIDIWGVNKRYLDNESFVDDPSDNFFAPTPADERVLADKGYFRVINLQDPFNESRTSYRFNSIGGYHGAKMSRYQDLIENLLNPEINVFVKKAQEGNFDYKGIQVLNMLNTKYILAGRGENAVFTNPEANGTAWFPDKVSSIQNDEEEMQLLGNINTKTEATYNAHNQEMNPSAGSGKIILSEYHPDKLVYQAEVKQSGLAVFSEIFYPAGWKAFINGEETEILKVNYLLRGLVLPEGEHTIQFEFIPKTYTSTKWIMVMFQYITVILLLVALFPYLKKMTR